MRGHDRMIWAYRCALVVLCLLAGLVAFSFTDSLYAEPTGKMPDYVG